MEVKIPYDEIKSRYPKAVDEIMKKLEAGKSKERGSKAEDLTWNINWWTWIEPDNETRSWSVGASKSRWKVSCSTRGTNEDFPKDLVEKYTPAKTEVEKEIENMSVEESEVLIGRVSLSKSV